MVYNRVDRKITRNICKLNGEQVFQKALRHTLLVNRFVEARVLKCKNDSGPVKCVAVETVGSKYSSAVNKNLQPTINKCFRSPDFKPKNDNRLKPHNYSIDRPVVPAKFFCLPIFDGQSVCK